MNNQNQMQNLSQMQNSEKNNFSNNNNLNTTNSANNNNYNNKNDLNNAMHPNGPQGLNIPNQGRNNTLRGVQSGSSMSMRTKKLPKQVESNSKYTENWINIRSINNGIIYNDRKEMVTGVKIRPKNIFILEQSEMDNTLIGLMNFYNTLDYEFWIVVADRPVDITMYQAELQLLFNKTQDQRIRKLISQDMDKGDYFADNNIVDTEYYLLFKEKDPNKLNKKVRDLITGFAGAGLIASQTSNDDLRLIIDNFLNGGRKYESGTVMPQ